MHTLDGLNARMRLYRYDAETADRFLPHFDECWPGSRVVLGGGDDEPILEQDRWRYSDGATSEATNCSISSRQTPPLTADWAASRSAPATGRLLRGRQVWS